MQKIDQKTVNDYKIPEIVLMENAGIKSVLAMCEMYPDLYNKSVLVVCGPGNNGGDGFVIARHLYNLGCSVNVVAAAQLAKFKGVTAENLQILEKMNIPVFEMHSESSIYEVLNMANFSDIIVDAIFGTGLSKKVDGMYLALINGLNSVAAQKFAVDIPSGIDGTSGLVMGAAIKASATVTFETPKIGHILDPGSQYIGKLFVADISVPKLLLNSADFKVNLTTEEFVSRRLPARPLDSNKGDHGRALIIGGSKLYCGAPQIACRALLRSGAGISYLMVPDSIIAQASSSLNDAIVIGLKSQNSGAFDSSVETIDSVLKFIDENKISSLGIGVGISQDPSAIDFTAGLLAKIKVPVCLDADGLMALKKHRAKILMNEKLKLVITPHPGEFSRLTDSNVTEVMMNRLSLCESFSKANRCVTLLKGHRSIICDESGVIYINASGNPAMAKGGMGDALTGLITGFMAYGMAPYEAAVCASYVHGKAGDIASASIFEYSMTTNELINSISAAMLAITKGASKQAGNPK